MAQKTDYTAEGVARLLQSLKERDDIADLLAAYLDRCQELEDAAYPILTQRSIDNAVGHRLDRIGQLVNLDRGGRNDDDYRLRIRAEFAILRSNGLVDDLINVLQLLLGMPTSDVQIDQYAPKTVYIRPRNWVVTEDTIVLAEQLRRAVSAATDLHLIFSTVESDDADVFRFSETTGVAETSKSYGFGNGTLDGVA